MKKIALLCGLLANSLLAQATETIADKIPASAKTIEAFIPEGWKIEQKLVADLTKDKIDDVVLELREDKTPSVESEIGRVLVVIMQSNAKTFTKVGVGEQVLLCPECFGMLGGANGEGNAEIKIRKGVLIIDQLMGSREARNTVYRFRYDAKTRRMALIGEDIKNYDRATGDAASKSINYLIGSQLDEVFKKGKTVSARKSKVSLKTKYMEDVINQ
jgi:hypothetical protein